MRRDLAIFVPDFLFKDTFADWVSTVLNLSVLVKFYVSAINSIGSLPFGLARFVIFYLLAELMSIVKADWL